MKKPTRLFTPQLIALCSILLCLNAPLAFAQTHYVATTGSNTSGDGSKQNPWSSISHAIDQVSDGATILVGAGTYTGRVRLDQKFQNGITIRSSTDYQAKLRYNNGATVICYSCQGVTFEGFDISHTANNTGALLIQIQTSEARFVTLRNNIIHDSTNNDLLKINNGTSDIVIQGNMFYNQSGSDEHIDINSAKDVEVLDNIFFNSNSQSATSSFVLVKDSNGNSDGVIGSKDISIRRNIFLNWQGNTAQSFIRVGEDSTPTFEAQDVLIENNLMLGNSSRMMRSSFTVGGSKNIRFQFNTVVGALPSRNFAVRMPTAGLANQNIIMRNNIWSDPTGSMGTEGFNGADVFEVPNGAVSSFTLDNNLYHNGNNAIPQDTSQGVKLADDSNAVMGNPLLGSQSGLSIPTYNGSTFNGGFTTIKEAFVDLANKYGKPAAGSLAIGQASNDDVPIDDLLGASRSANPEIGAIEVDGIAPPPPTTPSTNKKTVLSWLLLLLD